MRRERLMFALIVGTRERLCETTHKKFCHRRRRRRRKGSRRRELPAAAADIRKLFRRHRRSNDRLTPLCMIVLFYKLYMRTNE